MPTCVALVPARSGSKRLPNKNIKMLNGHPLMAYSIAAARDSGVFSAVVVSTDSEEYAEIARGYGAIVVLGGQDGSFHTDTSPDILWVRYTLDYLLSMLWRIDAFSIVRPTSPFRTADTIKRAWAEFQRLGDSIDSLRAVELCAQHPWKMWTVEENVIMPLMEHDPGYVKNGVPGHSRQYADLPPIYVQNASLEVSWVKTVLEKGSIAGDRIAPFFTEGHEGMDVNRPADWDAVELILSKQAASLPQIYRDPPTKGYMDHEDDPWWHYRTPDGTITHLDKVGAAWERPELQYLYEGTRGPNSGYAERLKAWQEKQET